MPTIELQPTAAFGRIHFVPVGRYAMPRGIHHPQSLRLWMPLEGNAAANEEHL